MKKVIKYFSLLIMILVLTACGTNKEDSKVTFENAVKKMKDVESLSMKMDIVTNMSSGGSTIAINMGIDVEMDKEQNMYAVLSASLFGYAETMEFYRLKQDGYNYMYMNDGATGWYYTKQESNSEPTEKNNEIDTFLDGVSNIKEEKSDKKGYIKIVATISKDQLNEAMTQLEEMQLPINATEYVLTKDIEVNIYIRDGYISIIEMDLGDAMSSIGDSEELPMNIGAKLKIELSDFNKVETITVPNSVIDNAVLYEESSNLDSELEMEPDADLVQV